MEAVKREQTRYRAVLKVKKSPEYLCYTSAMSVLPDDRHPSPDPNERSLSKRQFERQMERWRNTMKGACSPSGLFDTCLTHSHHAARSRSLQHESGTFTADAFSIGASADSWRTNAPDADMIPPLDPQAYGTVEETSGYSLSVRAAGLAPVLGNPCHPQLVLSSAHVMRIADQRALLKQHQQSHPVKRY